MPNIVVFGASSGLGFAVAEYFSHLGYEVIGVARSLEKNVALAHTCKALYSCDATDPQQVEEVVSQLPSDAWVISTMGSFNAEVPVDYIGHRYLINQLEKYDVKRFLMVTSLGCGESWAFLSERSKAGFGAAVREKSLAESWLTTSSLDYTILRPGGLKDGEPTETGVLSQGVETHGLITRSEVARLTSVLLSNPASIGQIYQCVDPEFKPIS